MMWGEILSNETGHLGKFGKNGTLLSYTHGLLFQKPANHVNQIMIQNGDS